MSLESGSVRVATHSFTPSFGGAEIDLGIMIIFQNSSGTNIQCSCSVVLDGDTTNLLSEVPFVAVPGSDTRTILSQVEYLTTNTHTIDLYLIGYGSSIQKLGVVIVGVTRYN